MVVVGNFLIDIVIYGDYRVFNDGPAQSNCTNGAALRAFAAADASLRVFELCIDMDVAVETGLTELESELWAILDADAAAHTQGTVDNGSFPLFTGTHFNRAPVTVKESAVFTELCAQTAIVAQIWVDFVLFVLLTAYGA